MYVLVFWCPLIYRAPLQCQRTLLTRVRVCVCVRQVSYAIGVAEPVSITVFHYGTSKLTQRQLLDIVKANFDLRPGRIVQ